MQILEYGTKVKYTLNGKELVGTIHGVKTHEDNKGRITRVAYLIDTGVVIREKAFADDQEIPEGIDITHALEQHEQIEVDQTQVKLA